MTAKSYNRTLILRAAWSRAKFAAAMLCEPVMRFLGDAMRDAWALAKGIAAPVATSMVPQPCQQQQACAAARIVKDAPMPTHAEAAPEQQPPHLDPAHEDKHIDYVAMILEELMDDTPAPPKPVPTELDRIVSDAFEGGIKVGRMLATRDYEIAMRDAIATMRKTQ